MKVFTVRKFSDRGEMTVDAGELDEIVHGMCIGQGMTIERNG